METGYIHSIETCGTVDGPGIRYVIFFSGCPMRCLYCHNPDTWDLSSGTKMSVVETLEGFYNNISFYSSGGVTVTGGEPMLQMPFLTALFRDLKKHSIHTCIDTSGITFNPDNSSFLDKLDELLALTDLILLDIKHIDDKEHQILTGHSNKNILEFARYLDQKNIPVWIRHVVIPGITLYREYLEDLGKFMAERNNIQALDVLPYHSMGKSKYKALGILYPLDSVQEPSREEAESAKQIILASYKKWKQLLY